MDDTQNKIERKNYSEQHGLMMHLDNDYTSENGSESF